MRYAHLGLIITVMKTSWTLITPRISFRASNKTLKLKTKDDLMYRNRTVNEIWRYILSHVSCIKKYIMLFFFSVQNFNELCKMIFKLFKNRNFNLRSKSNFAAWLLIKSIFWKLFVWCRFLISGRHCSREAIWPFSHYKFRVGSFPERSMPLCPCIEKHTKKHTEYCSSSKTMWAPFLS